MKEYCYDFNSQQVKRFNRHFPVYTSSEGFKNALHRLGLRAGDKVVVHSSLGSLGYFEGGAEGVCRSLMEYIFTPILTSLLPKRILTLRIYACLPFFISLPQLSFWRRESTLFAKSP